MNTHQNNANIYLNRRQFLGAMAGTLALSACATKPQPVKKTTKTMPKEKKMIFVNPDADNTIHLFAPSGYVADGSRIELGLQRLAEAGFAVSNITAAYRRSQRFAGTDQERAADLQSLATGKVPMPKMLLGLRGGYGAARILPLVDWASLGARMKERGTLLMGFSDVCAVQLALLAQGNMMSFSGPMLYSEFGKPERPEYTMQNFVSAVSNKPLTISTTSANARYFQIEGPFWGGNLSVLASLIGTPYFPDVAGGILFLEDVSEQPYRIDRMLQQLALSGCLKKQQAIILGNFRLPKNADVYDAAYDFPMVISYWQRKLGIPILQNFPFGHVLNKTTFPLGAVAKVQGFGDGYSVTWNDYPTLNADKLNLNALLAPPVYVWDDVENTGTNPDSF